jgi:hypothetical protein
MIIIAFSFTNNLQLVAIQISIKEIPLYENDGWIIDENLWDCMKYI